MKENSAIELQVGEQVEITLPGKQATGYEWMLRSLDQTILETVGQPEYKPESDALGAGGRFILHLKAIAIGETWIEMVYRRYFDPQDVPPIDEYRVLVKITQ